MTSGQAPPLPDRIESVIVPERFHPSTFVDLERCPLSVLGHSAVQSDGLLTIHPMAYLGIVLHHTRHEVVEGRWGGAKDATAAAADVLTLTVKFVEGELASRSITADLVPLSESVGRRRWKNSIRTLERWAAAQVVEGRDEVPRLPDLSDRVDRDVDEEGLRVTLGSEQGMADPSLRLRGRPDWSGRADDGRIEIVDFKSGRITDREGRLLDQHVAQLQLYSLMMEAAFPAATVVPLLEQDHRIQVPWEPIDRQLIRQRLDSVSIGLPSGETVAASSDGTVSLWMRIGRCELTVFPRPSRSPASTSAIRSGSSTLRPPRTHTTGPGSIRETSTNERRDRGGSAPVASGFRRARLSPLLISPYLDFSVEPAAFDHSVVPTLILSRNGGGALGGARAPCHWMSLGA